MGCIMIIENVSFLANRSNQFYMETEDAKYSFWVPNDDLEKMSALSSQANLRDEGYIVNLDTSAFIEVNNIVKAVIENKDGSLKFQCEVARLRDNVKVDQLLHEDLNMSGGG